MARLSPGELTKTDADESALPPDPVIEAYKKDIDRTLFRENLRLTIEQRIRKLEAFMRSLESIRGSARKARND